MTIKTDSTDRPGGKPLTCHCAVNYTNCMKKFVQLWVGLQCKAVYALSQQLANSAWQGQAKPHITPRITYWVFDFSLSLLNLATASSSSITWSYSLPQRSVCDFFFSQLSKRSIVKKSEKGKLYCAAISHFSKSLSSHKQPWLHVFIVSWHEHILINSLILWTLVSDS